MPEHLGGCATCHQRGAWPWGACLTEGAQAPERLRPWEGHSSEDLPSEGRPSAGLPSAGGPEEWPSAAAPRTVTPRMGSGREPREGWTHTGWVVGVGFPEEAPCRPAEGAEPSGAQEPGRIG